MNFSEIQQAVHVAKDKKNDFGGYNYRTAEGILASIKAVLVDGESITVTDSLQELAGQIFVSSTAEIKLSNGETYSATGHALHPLTKKGMDPSQITGAASSYARKYALSGLMALDDGSVDPDATAGRKDAEPSFDPSAFRDRVKAKIAKAKTIADLQEAFKEAWSHREDLPAPMLGELTKAKDDRKAALTPPDPAMQAPADNPPLYQ